VMMIATATPYAHPATRASLMARQRDVG